MANPKFLGVDLSSITFGWKTSAGSDNNNASYPGTNLKNYYPNSVAKGNDASDNQYVLIDFGSAVSFNTAIIEGMNFIAVGADQHPVLEYNTNDDTSWGDAVTAATFNRLSDAVQMQAVTPVSKRYWRLWLPTSVPYSVAPQIGNIFLGTTLDFEKPQQWGFFTNMPFNPKSVDLRSLDNTGRTAVTGKNIRKHLISFDDKNTLTDSFITSYLAFLTTTYNGKVPFYYVDNNGAIYLVKFEKDYNPYETFLKDQNKIQNLAMESVMADA